MTATAIALTADQRKSVVTAALDTKQVSKDLGFLCDSIQDALVDELTTLLKDSGLTEEVIYDLASDLIQESVSIDVSYQN